MPQSRIRNATVLADAHWLGVAAGAPQAPVCGAARRLVARIAEWVRLWRERERERRELAGMRRSDFGDLPVAQSLINEEVRRWPWQRPNPQWAAVRPLGGRDA